MRSLRDEYKSKLQDLKDEWDKLKLKYDITHEELQQLKNENSRKTFNSNSVVYDSIEKKDSHSMNHVRIFSVSNYHSLMNFNSSRERLNAVYQKHKVITTVIEQSFYNSRYKNVSTFREESEKWKDWRLSLFFKFENSWENFLIERFKIIYARDNCQDAIFNVIVNQADLDEFNTYETINKLLQNLKINFDEKNRYHTTLNDIINSSFNMSV